MKTLIQATLMLVVMTVLCGVLYPATVTVLAQLIWPAKANGSLVFNKDQVVGSALIGQHFSSDRYFWGRPSASDYGTVPSAASNLGPTSKVLKEAIAQRRAAVALAHHVTADQVPDDLVTASASGLDPHILLSTARFQLDRVMRARGWDLARKPQFLALIDAHTQNPLWGVFGVASVNVLALNRALDAL